MSKPGKYMPPMGWVAYVCPQHHFKSQYNGDDILAGGVYPEDITEHKREFHGSNRKSVRLGTDDRRVPQPGTPSGAVEQVLPGEPDTDAPAVGETREGGIRVKRVPYSGS